MGRGYDAICNFWGTKFQVNEGSGMINPHANTVGFTRGCSLVSRGVCAELEQSRWGVYG